MDEKIIEEEEFRKGMLKARRREWMNDKLHKLNHFYYQYRDDMMVFGPIIFGVIGGTAKAVRSHTKYKQEKDLKDLYCYDRSSGHYWKLKHKLRNSEWVKIEARRKKGERIGDILNDMKLLK